MGTGRGLRAAPQSPGSHRLRCPQLNPTGKIKPTAERDDLVKIEICLRTVTGENRFSPILCRLPSPSKKCLGNSNHRKQNNQGRSVRGQGLGAGQADPSHSHSSHRGWDRDGKGWVRSGQDGTGHSCLPRHGVSPKAAATPQGSRCREHWGAVGQTPGQRDGQQVGGQGEARVPSIRDLSPAHTAQGGRAGETTCPRETPTRHIPRGRCPWTCPSRGHGRCHPP